MTTRREQAGAVLFSLLMVVSMVAGSVAFGGLAAADNSTVNGTDGESLVDTESLSAEEDPDANTTNGSDSEDIENSTSTDDPGEENETATGVENRTHRTDGDENATNGTDSVSDGTNTESVAHNDSDGRVINTTSSENGTASTSETNDTAGPAAVEASSLEGSGTEADPHLVTNVSELQAVRNDLDAHYELGNDIDASSTAQWNDGRGFYPIGLNRSTAFNGSFDGAGHTITGLTIDRPINSSELPDNELYLLGRPMGLFGRVGPDGHVERVSLTAVNVGNRSAGFNQEVGGAVGVNAGTVEDVSVEGHVIGQFDVGGLAGFNIGSISEVSADVTATGTNTVGALIGQNGGAQGNGELSNAAATGLVNGTAASAGGLVGVNGVSITNASANTTVNGHSGVGGLVGSNSGSLTDVSATGRVNGTDDTVGGLVGTNTGTITNAAASGRVDGLKGDTRSASTNEIGGLVGSSSGTITTALATGNVSGSDDVGGLVGDNTGAISIAAAYGSVEGSRHRVGGLVGDHDDIDAGTIANTSARGSVSGSERVGGLVGENTASIEHSFAVGNVSGSGMVGGVVGAADGAFYSYWDVETTGQASTAGDLSDFQDADGLTTSQMTGDAARTNMTDLTFGSVWQTQTNDYPVLTALPSVPGDEGADGDDENGDGVADEGTPIDSCTVLGESGRYRLNSSLGAGGSGCIEITTSDVVFDGDGRTITDSNDAVAIQNDTANLSNVTVRDLTISDADRGVLMEFTTTDPTRDLTLRNLTMEGVGTGVAADSLSDRVPLVDFAVIDSTINTTTGDGVDVYGNNDEAYDVELRRNDINATAGNRGIDFRIRDDGTAVDLSLEDNDIRASESEGIHLDLERAEASTNLSLRGNDVTVSEGIGDYPVDVKNNVREPGVNNTIHATVTNNTLTAGGLVDTALRFELHGADGSRVLDVRNNTMNRQLDIDANGANTSLGLALTDNVIQSNESDTSTAVSVVTESDSRYRSSSNQLIDLVIERNEVAGQLAVDADDDGADANVSVVDNTFADDNPDSSDGIGLNVVVSRENATKRVDVRRNRFTGENSDLFVRAYGDNSVSRLVAANNTVEQDRLYFDLQESASPSASYNQTIDAVVTRNDLNGSGDRSGITVEGSSSRTANVSITDNNLTSVEGDAGYGVAVNLFGIGLDAETEFRRNTVTDGSADGLGWDVAGHGATADVAIANNTVRADRWAVYLSGGENQTLDVDLTDNDLTTSDPDPTDSDAGVRYSNTDANTSLRLSVINNTVNSTQNGISLDLSEGPGGGAAPLEFVIEENQIQAEGDGIQIDNGGSFTPIKNRIITVDAVDNVIESGITGFGIDVENDGGSEIVTIEDNRIDASSGAVSLDHVGDRKNVDVAVRDNEITGDRSSGISVTADGTSGIFAEPPGTRDITVADNNLTMTDGGGISLSADAENLTANLTVTDNVVDAGRYSRGIVAETGSDGATIDANISRNDLNVTDEDGIVIEAFDDDMSTAFTVADNVVAAGAESGIVLDGGENHTATWGVVDNRIDRPDTGIELDGIQVLDPSVFDVTVRENEVDNGSEVGIDIDPESGTAPPSGTVRVAENNVSSDATAVLIDEGPVAGIDLSDNRLIADGFGVENRNTTAGTYVNATNNYWGASDGPGSAGPYEDPVTGTLADGSGSNVTNATATVANVRFDPFVGGSAATPRINTSGSSIRPTETSINESQQYEVSVRIENTSLSDDAGAVDVRFEGFDIDTGDDDLTVNYTADNVTDGTLTVSTNVSATAPSTAGARAVTVTDLRREADSGADEYLIEDANVTIGTIDVTESDDPAGDGINLAPFDETTHLAGTQTDPTSLAGKFRVEGSIAPATNVTLLENSSSAYSINITAPNGSENVTFYLQERAVSSSQDIEDVRMLLDGQPREFTIVEGAGPGSGSSPWIAFTVPEFSTRTVTFTSTETLVVDPASGTGDFDTIQGALDSANDTDTIEVRPGTYEEPVDVEKNVTLVAPDGATIANTSAVADEYGSIESRAGLQIFGPVEPEIAGFTLVDWRWGLSAGASEGAWRFRDSHIRNSSLAVGAAGTETAWTVDNVTITDAESGVSAFESRGAWSVQDSRVTNSSEAVFAVESSGNWTIENTEIHDVDDAIDAERSAGDWSVNATNVSNATDTAIDAVGSAGNASVRGTTIETTSEEGIALGDSTKNWLIENTTVHDTGGSGIDAGNVSGTVVIRNATVRDTGGHGIEVETSTGAWTIASSTVQNTTRDGIDAFQTQGNGTVANVTVTDTENGVNLYNSSGAWLITDTVIRNNSRSAVTAGDSTADWAIIQSVLTNGSGVAVDANGAVPAGQAAENYWGAADGPSGDFNGTGGEALGNLTVSPFYMDAALRVPAQIAAGQVSANRIVFAESETEAVDAITFQTEDDIDGEYVEITEAPEPDEPTEDAIATDIVDPDNGIVGFAPGVAIDVRAAPSIDENDAAETANITLTAPLSEINVSEIAVIRVPDDASEAERLNVTTTTDEENETVEIEAETPGFSTFVVGEVETADSGGGGDGDNGSDDDDDRDGAAGFAVDLLETPENVTVDGELSVTASVRNDGDATETKNVSLGLDDESVNQTAITLNASESTTVTLTYVPTADDVGENLDLSVSTPDATATGTVDVLPRIEAVVDVEQEPVAGGTPAEFNASDSVGRNLTYTWELETAEDTISGPNVTHSYAEAGEYNVTLIVEDEFGQTNETTTTVTVASESTEEVPGFGSLVTLLALITFALLVRGRSS
ncbi:PKD domain-containing protein [Halorubrum sp. CBA1125]|uniref:right-handed parallel beta-helix repeat-containing protein n=1 Tax=Halorubrum sp. CBA1125 TaxID=2668072 RepID=UPI0012E74FBC|nr:right-handed parallel beta-helix repeat-containing protein [Halorubrum sp. CBA1125]MUW14172.1 PKD domain-containing protein [Halorubrum sp. CBA1125]